VFLRISGTVINVQVFTREGIERDARAQQIIADELKGFKKDLADQMRIVEDDAFGRIARLLEGKTANGGPKKLAKGTAISKEYLDGVERHNCSTSASPTMKRSRQLEQLKDSLAQKRLEFDAMFEVKKRKLTSGRIASRRAENGQGLRSGLSRRLQPGTRCRPAR